MTRLARIACTLVLALAPVGVAGQVPFDVSGRVYEVGTDAGVVNAVVELEGLGARLTDRTGAFRFQTVGPGSYTVHVSALGYATLTRTVVMEAATTLELPLQVQPIPLDALSSRRVDLQGRVRDPVRNFQIPDAQAFTSQGQLETTDSHGKFDIDGVMDGVPLTLGIRAFGYLPIDTEITPREDDEERLFEMEIDSLVQKMIDVQVERLKERAKGYVLASRPALDRAKLLTYANAHTLESVLDFAYLRRPSVKCLVLDEKVLTPYEIHAYLATMIPEEVERIEVMGAMVRVYTRAFMQEMTMRDIELPEPVYVQFFPNSPPLCR